MIKLVGILEYRGRFPDSVDQRVEDLARISRWLRKAREFSFYGDLDFVPTEQYTSEDALRATRDAQFVVDTTQRVIRMDA